MTVNYVAYVQNYSEADQYQAGRLAVGSEINSLSSYNDAKLEKATQQLIRYQMDVKAEAFAPFEKCNA